jgi:UDP-N-acetylglucosamine 2-epimerase (non-hydrolysing)
MSTGDANMVKALIVVGTRPEVVKLAPVIFEMRRDGHFEVRICATGQHRQMLDQALKEFDLHPDVALSVMTERQSLSGVTARLFDGLESVISHEQPACVIVQGDTTSSFVAAMVAYYHRCPVAHVEAGLRTGNRYSPFPEEMNRVVVDQLSEWLFAPTAVSRQNLLKAGFPEKRISVTGNTVVDALLHIREKQRRPEEQAAIADQFEREFGFLPADRMILVTGHRRESFGAGFEQICRAIRAIVDRNPDVSVVYPVHLNPNVQEPVHRVLGGLTRVRLIPPLGYSTLIWLLDRSFLVLTDSGGIQEEAPTFRKPALVMRHTTERPEGIEAGVARLVGTEEASIVSAVQEMLDDPAVYRKMAAGINPYGDGTAAKQIVAILRNSHLSHSNSDATLKSSKGV